MLLNYDQNTDSDWFIRPQEQQNNKRTKTSSGRVGKAIVSTCIFSGGYRRHRKLEGSFARAGLGATEVNWLISSGPKTAGQIGHLGGNFSHHY